MSKKLGKIHERKLFGKHKELRDFVFDGVNKKDPMLRWATKHGLLTQFRQIKSKAKADKLEEKLRPIKLGGSYEDFEDGALDSDEDIKRVLEEHGIKLGGGK